MLYYLPDARDVVDPSFDFTLETRSPDRLKREDQYAHEVFGAAPYDGMLVSMALVKGKYASEERRRLFRSGFREFGRVPDHVKIMGDCGAFSYADQFEPPYTVTEVADYYSSLRVDHGFALDHLIKSYDRRADGSMFDVVDPDARRRFDLTLKLASDFWDVSASRNFEPIGVAQGWSPGSYADAVGQLQRIGYTYIALGGVVALRTDDLLEVLRAVDVVRDPSTRIHLLGVTRPGNFLEFESLGVHSIDSTSPLRRAWMDARQNFYLGDDTYAALRVPQSFSPKIRGRIESGELDADRARRAEELALRELAKYSVGDGKLQWALDALLAYQDIHSPGLDREADYRRTLEVRPWTQCDCSICRDLGHHVIMLRGADRSRRRGFHNVRQFYQSLLAETGRHAH